MKRSVVRVSALALALACVGTLTASCADSKVLGIEEPVLEDGGEITPPTGDGDATAPLPEASTDAGKRACSYHGFCPTALPPKQTLTSVWSDGTGVAWAVSTQGNVLRWDGAAWTIHASDLGELAVVWGAGPTDVWIGGQRGLLHGTGPSSDALAFTPVTLENASARIVSIWGRSESDVWAVGDADHPETGYLVGAAFHFTDQHWSLVPIETAARRYSIVWGSPATGVWIAAERPMEDMPWMNELFLLRTRGGEKENFTELALPADPHVLPPLGTPGSIRGGVAVSDTSIWLHGSSSASWPITWRGASADNGATFTFTAERDGTPNAPQINAIFGTAEDDVWTVGDYGQVRHFDGARWASTAVTNAVLPLTNTFHAVWARGTSEVWLVGEDIALRYDPAQDTQGGAK